MSADAQWEAIRIVLDAGGKATPFEHDLAYERLEMFRERQQRQDEEIQRLRVERDNSDKAAEAMSADVYHFGARVQQLEEALREIAQGNRHIGSIEAAAPLVEIARAALGETEVLNDRV